MRFFHKCKARTDIGDPLIVSGYGHTQYEINFCECGKVVWELTIDGDGNYPSLLCKTESKERG